MIIRDKGILYTYTGKISFPTGAPTLLDIAVSLSREGRYAGAGMRWWPVALHTFVVCDLLPPELKLHGLLHDASESITGDVPKPVKTRQIEELEAKLAQAIYRNFHVKPPTAAQHKAIKKADVAAMCGEVYIVGTQSLQAEYPRAPKAEKLVVKYLDEYPPMECITPDGRCVIEFIRRFRIYSDMLNPACRT